MVTKRELWMILRKSVVRALGVDRSMDDIMRILEAHSPAAAVLCPCVNVYSLWDEEMEFGDEPLTLYEEWDFNNKMTQVTHMMTIVPKSIIRTKANAIVPPHGRQKSPSAEHAVPSICPPP